MKRIRLSGENAPDSGVTTATFWSVRTRQTNPIAWAALSASPLPDGTGANRRIAMRVTRNRFAIPHLPLRRGKGNVRTSSGPGVRQLLCIQYTAVRMKKGESARAGVRRNGEGGAIFRNPPFFHGRRNRI